MKRIITMIIEDEAQVTLQASACSNEGGNVFITARTLQEAQGLIATGAAQLAEAMKNWQPEEEQEEELATDQKHYYISRSMEEMNEAAQAYEESPAGQRFTKRVDNAVAFYFKHSKGGLLCTQLEYLANKHYNSLLNGSIDLSALAYRTGYNAGKAAAKK